MDPGKEREGGPSEGKGRWTQGRKGKVDPGKEREVGPNEGKGRWTK